MSSIAEALGARPAGRTDTATVVALACFGLGCLAGLLGAFVGLDMHGFWFDELFTARLIEADGTGLMARIATDVHPPVYLVLLWLYSQVAGDSDTALRSLSALAACASIVVFVAASRGRFSLPGRLFGAAMATGSLFWFFQAQNARSYALCLLIGAGILGCSLALLDERARERERLLLGGLIGLMFVGSFTHFYVLYESLAVLALLFVLRRRQRLATAGAAIALLAAVALYMKLVVEPHTLVSLSHNWYQNDPAWYYEVLKSCLHYTLGDAALLAIGLCAAAVLAGRLARRDAGLGLEPATALLAGVPVLVLLAAVASSTLLAPNFFDRNYLVLSPFFWALAARLYDGAQAALPPRLRLPMNAALGVLVLSTASIVMLRLPSDRAPSMYEPFRESAQWITTLSACRGEIVPVISTDRAEWYKADYAATIHTSGYGRYLHGFARPQHLFFHELRAQRLPADLRTELQRRIDGAGCPVLAWAVHNVTPEIMAAATTSLLAATNRAGATVKTKAFDDGSPAFVLYLNR